VKTAPLLESITLEPSPAIEAYKSGIDRSLLGENLPPVAEWARERNRVQLPETVATASTSVDAITSHAGLAPWSIISCGAGMKGSGGTRRESIRSRHH
jgi:hypothetical protein